MRAQQSQALTPGRGVRLRRMGQRFEMGASCCPDAEAATREVAAELRLARGLSARCLAGTGP